MTTKRKILVTGGTGFIGSHTVAELQQNNYDVIIVDNLSNSSIEVLDNITSSRRLPSDCDPASPFSAVIAEPRTARRSVITYMSCQPGTGMESSKDTR